MLVDANLLDYPRLKRVPLETVHNSIEARDVIATVSPFLLLIGTSENPDSLGLKLVAEARAGLDQAAREIGNRLASARRGDEQNRWLYVAGVCGVALGLFLYALLAGPIARWTPDSWRWPERMATRVLNEPGPWGAGQRLMQAADPESWALIVAASPLTDANRETVQKCREQAAKAAKPVRCTIEVKADSGQKS